MIILCGQSTTADLMKHLRAAKGDQEAAVVVKELNREGKALFGDVFNLRFEHSILSKDVVW